METITKIDNIKNLFENIKENNNQEDFFEKISSEFNMSKSSVRTNWFSRFEIPRVYKVQDQVIEFMQNYIKHQKV